MSPTRSLGRRIVAFTLIELLIVITIIAVLIGISFPAYQGIQERAKKVQAQNDLTQMVTGINAFYTEYGQYPCSAQPGDDSRDFFGGDDTTQAKLFTDLRGIQGLTDTALNPRVIAYVQPPVSKALTHADAKSGICRDGHWHDPWGSPYRIKMDNNYNNQIENPYNNDTGAGFSVLNAGAIAWSLGKDQDGAKTGTKGNGGPKKSSPPGKADDDVISWQ
jgi:prepilin-type N-terminal cleavage/methylation domain-containing protein